MTPPPEHLRIKCKIPLSDGQPCGVWKLYRVMPKGYVKDGKTPEQIQSDIKDNVRAKMVDFFSTHINVKHEAEFSAIQESIQDIQTYVLLEKLEQIITTTQEA